MLKVNIAVSGTGQADIIDDLIIAQLNVPSGHRTNRHTFPPNSFECRIHFRQIGMEIFLSTLGHVVLILTEGACECGIYSSDIYMKLMVYEMKL